MSFMIGRLEHFKAPDCAGVFRESSRNLSRYPNSHIDPSKTPLNVALVELLDPTQPIPEQIAAYRRRLGCKGRFVVRGSNPKVMTNIMSQAFFKLPSDVLDTLDYEGAVTAYCDCLSWLCQRYPSIHVVGAYVHVDEPEAGPHLHVNFLPVTPSNRFSTSELFPGPQAYADFQEALYNWALLRFPSAALERRKPDSALAIHLSVPEYRAAMTSLEEVKAELSEYEALRLSCSSLSSLGRRGLFGGVHLSDQEYTALVEAASLGCRSDVVIRQMIQDHLKQLDFYKSKYEREKRYSEALERGEYPRDICFAKRSPFQKTYDKNRAR